MKWFILIVVAGIVSLFVVVNTGLFETWTKSPASKKIGKALSDAVNQVSQIAQDPYLRQLQLNILKVKSLNSYTTCAETVPALHLSGGFIVLKSDLLRYPRWLVDGQVYEACFRSCPEKKRACDESYTLIYEADAWLRANPIKKKKPKKTRRRQKKKRRKSN